MTLKVAISTVADGSMLRRGAPSDPGVIKNREVFLAKHSISLNQTTRVSFSYETHTFTRYYTVNNDEKGIGMSDASPINADALVTTQSHHALFLPLADCIGAVLYDSKQHVLMMSHLGRHSLEQHGGSASVQFLKEHFHSNPADIEVWLTPAAGKENYPIWSLENKGLKEVVYEQLVAAGINESHIHDDPTDTTTDERYYSYSEFLKGNRSEDGDYAIVAMMTD